MYVYHDAEMSKYEVCYMTAYLDPSMGYAPVGGLTVEENEFTYDCTWKDGDYIPYTAPKDKEGNGSVKLMGDDYDLLDWTTIEPYYYAWAESMYPDYDMNEDWEDWEDDMNEDWEDKEDEWNDWEDEYDYDYDYDDWEYDYDYGMDYYGYSDDYGYDYGYDYGMDYYGYSDDYDYDYGYDEWDYYGYGETYYYMDGPEDQGGIMEQITGWFSGDASNNMLTAIASIATIAAMQI
jgi:DNA-directed RNA polymerase subunit delta